MKFAKRRVRHRRHVDDIDYALPICGKCVSVCGGCVLDAKQICPRSLMNADTFRSLSMATRNKPKKIRWSVNWTLGNALKRAPGIAEKLWIQKGREINYNRRFRRSRLLPTLNKHSIARRFCPILAEPRNAKSCVFPRKTQP